MTRLRAALLYALSFLAGTVLVFPVIGQGLGVYDSIQVDSVARDALDVRGGLVLGVALDPPSGGVASKSIILFNGTTCPDGTILFPTTIPGLGSLIACAYIESTAALLGSAILGSAILQ